MCRQTIPFSWIFIGKLVIGMPSSVSYFFFISISWQHVRIEWISLSYSECVFRLCARIRVFYPSLTNHFKMRNGFRALRNCVWKQCVIACVGERPTNFYTMLQQSVSLLFFALPLFLSCMLSVRSFVLRNAYHNVRYWFCWPLYFLFCSFRSINRSNYQFAHQLKIIYTFDQIIYSLARAR